MSKAFTSEETEDVPVLGRLAVRAAPGQERPITSDGHAALVASRDALRVQRDHAKRASNREGQDVVRAIKHRLALVEATLASVRVQDPAPADGVARFGSTVALVDEGGTTRRVRLVGPDEANGTSLVSVLSPLGRALLGARAGGDVEVERPSRTVVFVVKAVE